MSQKVSNFDSNPKERDWNKVWCCRKYLYFKLMESLEYFLVNSAGKSEHIWSYQWIYSHLRKSPLK